MTLSPRQSRSRLSWRLLVCAGVLLSLSLGLASCSSDVKPSLREDQSAHLSNNSWFEDITNEVGIDFVHDAGPTDSYFMPASMGSGCAVFDFDGDGLLDIYLLQFGGPKSRSVNRLYRQLPGGKFQDVTEGSGLGIAGYNHGVAIADVNNDGRPDVLITQYGGIRLFLNMGGGKFEDVTAESGLLNPLWGMSAAFLDYNRDGLLDLVVVNYLDYDPRKECLTPDGARDFCSPGNFPGVSSKLFRNLGPTPAGPGRPAARIRFEDVSLASGIGKLPGPGLGVVCADFTGDGWPDIFVANDGKENRLWVNQRDGTFKNEAVSRNVAVNAMSKAYAGMGVAAGDVKNNGFLDLFVTHLGKETNTLWCQKPAGTFRDQTAESGLTNTLWRGTGFGTVMADFNLDGALDIAVANGSVLRGGLAKNTGLGFWETYAERNQVFANDGSGKFSDVSEQNPQFCGEWNVGRGLVCADINNDGAPDLLVTTCGGKTRLYRNKAANRGHWLKVMATEPALHRAAYGAEIRVRAGKSNWLRLINPGESYLCSGAPIAVFGLGLESTFDSIVVTWPDGSREGFPGGQADCLIELQKGRGKPQ